MIIPVVPAKNPPYCIILNNWENFILADKLFAKVLQIFKTCVSVNNLCGKSTSSLKFSIKFHEIFKVTSAPFFIPDFNLLSFELEYLHLPCYIESFYISIILNQNKFVILWQFLV